MPRLFENARLDRIFYKRAGDKRAVDASKPAGRREGDTVMSGMRTVVVDKIASVTPVAGPDARDSDRRGHSMRGKAWWSWFENLEQQVDLQHPGVDQRPYAKVARATSWSGARHRKALFRLFGHIPMRSLPGECDSNAEHRPASWESATPQPRTRASPSTARCWVPCDFPVSRRAHRRDGPKRATSLWTMMHR